MNLTICIIGCGPRGRTHAAAWRKVEGAEIVAVCDIRQDRMTALAEETGATPYSDWRTAIGHERVTVVSQALPTCLHAEVTIAAAKRGLHVFGEKPLALTIEEGEAMIETVERAGTVFMPCFQYRDQPVYREYRRAFRAGSLGTPVAMQFTDVREVRPKTDMHSRSRNGGVVIDMACHIFDLMRWITGEEPERIYATGHIFGRGKPRLAEISDFAVDEASINLAMAGGHHLQMYLNWGMPEGFGGFPNGHTLVGPDAALRPAPDGVEWLTGEAGRSRSSESAPDGASAGAADQQVSLSGEPLSANDIRVLRFADALRSRAEQDVTGADGLIALRLSHAALRSIDTGEPVVL